MRSRVKNMAVEKLAHPRSGGIDFQPASGELYYVVRCRGEPVRGIIQFFRRTITLFPYFSPFSSLSRLSFGETRAIVRLAGNRVNEGLIKMRLSLSRRGKTMFRLCEALFYGNKGPRPFFSSLRF